MLSAANSIPESECSPNEARRLSYKYFVGKLLSLFVFGATLSAAFPPLEWNFLVWVVPAAAMFVLKDFRIRSGIVGGWCFGMGYALTAFFWLREIHPAIPWVLMPILGSFYALWGGLLPSLYKYCCYTPEELMLPEQKRSVLSMPHWSKQLLFAGTSAALWVMIELLRSSILPWNYLSASQYQWKSLIQICAIFGTPGISFLIAFFNSALLLAILQGRKEKQKFLPIPLFVAVGMILATVCYGQYKLSRPEPTGKSFRIALAQGDISQRRNAGEREAKEALDIYTDLSRPLAALRPDLLIWPECAVPYPLMADAIPLCQLYRRNVAELILKNNLPMLIGTLDFQRDAEEQLHSYNAATLLDNRGRIAGNYYKIHRVPFGEYIPLRRFLPGWFINIIDMHRDLSAGKDFTPLTIAPEFRAGVNICFEDVFPYIARKEAQLGANAIIVITNDAWYPTSSEPDQHLANSIFRTIETNLPMIRCGNNSASAIIDSRGRVQSALFSTLDGQPDPYRRGRTSGILNVTLPATPELTFYCQYPFFSWLIPVALLVVALLQMLNTRLKIYNTLTKQKKAAEPTGHLQQ